METTNFASATTLALTLRIAHFSLHSSVTFALYDYFVCRSPPRAATEALQLAAAAGVCTCKQPQVSMNITMS